MKKLPVMMNLPGKMNKKGSHLKLGIHDLLPEAKINSSVGVLYRKRMNVGREIHEKYQRENKDIQSEVYIKYSTELSGTKITIRGRIDGIRKTKQEIQIVEIKSVEEIPSIEEVIREDGLYYHYYLQLMLYCYFYSEIQSKNISKSMIKPKLIFFQLSTKNKVEYPLEYFDKNTVENYLNSKLSEILQLYDKQLEFQNLRKQIAEKMEFPFQSYRKYQEEMVQNIIEVLKKPQHNLMISAPTGIGKTVAALYPTIKFALRQNKRLFFCHSRTTQQKIVSQTLKAINESIGEDIVGIFSVIMTAKEKLCILDEMNCNPESCPYLTNYQFPSLEVLEEAFQTSLVDRNWILKKAELLKTCPFELQLDLSFFADVIVGDYNYVFDPRVFLRRFFIDTKISKKFVMIIDEAHSLYNRSLSYYSPVIPRIMVEELNETDYGNRYLNRAKSVLFNKLLRYFDDLKQKTQNNKKHVIELDVPFLKNLQRSLDDLLFDIYFKYKVQLSDDLIPKFSSLFKFFAQVATNRSENFKHLYDPIVEEISIVCLDASKFLKRRHKIFFSTIAMSATLTPNNFFKNVLGFNSKKTSVLTLPSPFPKENRKIIIDKRFDTTYNARQRTAAALGNYIVEFSDIFVGNYFVFFPSFDYAKRVRKYIKRRRGWRVLQQKRNMDYKQKNKFINILKKQKTEFKGCLVLAVQSGVYAEGMDYPDSLLDGIIVISPGTLKPTVERELIRKYYDSKNISGFHYAYIAPGINRVIQAAGRLIRSEKDIGVILLIGKRFVHRNYSKYLPLDWFTNSPHELVYDKPLEVIKTFWDAQKD